MAPRKNQFRFKVENDLILLTEVESQNPFAFKNPRPVWCDIASKCQEVDPKMDVNDRNCRERTELLLKQFDKEELVSKRASGVMEEDMDKLKLLLTNIKKLKTNVDPTIHKLYSKSSRLEAEKIRDEAIATLDSSDESSSEPSPPPSSEVDGSTDAKDDILLSTPTSRKRKQPKLEPADYLLKKLEMESGFKKDELRIRELEVSNRRLEIEFQKEKLDQEMQLKRAKLELEKSERESQVNERNKLMEILAKIVAAKNI